MDILPQIFNVLNTREQAIAIWVTFVLCVTVHNKKTRNALKATLKAFCSAKITVALATLLAYVGLVVFLLKALNIWTTSLLKLTIFWFFGSATIYLFRLTQGKGGHRKFFFTVLSNEISFLVVFEYIAGIHTFPLWGEFLFVSPLLAFVNFTSETSQSTDLQKKATKTILVTLAVVTLSYNLYYIYIRWEAFASIRRLREFILPILLTIFIIPYLYIALLYMIYEQLFTRLEIMLPDNAYIRQYARWNTVKVCHLSMDKTTYMLEKYVHQFTPQSDKAEIQKILNRLDKDFASASGSDDTEAPFRVPGEDTSYQEERRHGLTKAERKQMWWDLLKAEDRAEVEADIRYPIDPDHITPGFTFENARQIMVDETKNSCVPPGSTIKVKERREEGNNLQFYCEAYRNAQLLQEGWIKSLCLLNQGLDLWEKNSQENAEYNERLREEYTKYVLEEYDIDEETARAITTEGCEKDWSTPAPPTVDEYINRYGRAGNG